MSWKRCGYACIFDGADHLISTTRLFNKGNQFKIGKKIYTFDMWKYGEKKPLSPRLSVTRISNLHRVMNGLIHSSDF